MDTPADDLYRAVAPARVELRAADSGMPTLETRFAVFDEWTEIDSWFEGRFMERLAHGAFAKTIRESLDQVKVLYDHGHDFHVGNKVLGPIESITEEKAGPLAVVPLLDTSYNRDLVPGLEAGLYGASFRFRIVKDEWDEEPERSDHNPDGIPERTIKEVRLYEFGPVTFPAYPQATAGLRSLSDRYHRDLRTHPGDDRRAAEPHPPADEPREHSLVIPHTTRRERIALIGGRLHKEQ